MRRLEKLLTIAIPTYNRSGDVMALVQNIRNSGAGSTVGIDVFDDGSDDDTAESLMRFSGKKDYDLRVFSESANQGYAKNFVKIFELCETEYVMVMADDDAVITENISRLHAVINQGAPKFLSPQYLIESKVYRGRNVLRAIEPIEYRECSSHAPGLIYEVATVRKYIPYLKDAIEKGNAFALVYPQVLLVIRMLIEYPDACIWIPFPTAAQGAAKPSGIKDGQGRAYGTVESRWRQIADLEGLLKEYMRSIKSNYSRDVVCDIYELHQKSSYHRLMNAIGKESPSLRSAFDKESELSFMKARLRRLFFWENKKK